MKRHNNNLPILSTAAMMALAGAISNAQVPIEPLAYSTSFEAPTYVVGALDGQDKWTVSPEETPKSAALVAKAGTDGSQALLLLSKVLGGGDTEWIRPVEHTIAADKPVLEVAWDMYLDSGKPHSMAWQFTVYSAPSHAISTLFVAGDAGDAVWYRTGGAAPVATSTHVKRDAWNHFHIRLDFAHGTAAYSVNDVDVDPVNTHSVLEAGIKAIDSIGIRVMGPGEDSALIDSIAIRADAAACAANCDGSLIAPVLNVNDYLCFMNEFSKALDLPIEKQIDSYANFDRSTKKPVLNINDFTAFMSAYAAGCK